MPRLTIVIGANGAGKSSWCRWHRTELPACFYDIDSIAQGLGDYNNPERQREARQIVDEAIARHLDKKEDFGFESTYSGNSRPEIVRRAFELGYDADAVFIGTIDSDINIERVARRVSQLIGHEVPRAEVRRRWFAAQQNLARTARFLRSIAIIDNSKPDHARLREQGVPETPRPITNLGEDAEPWVLDLWSAIKCGGFPGTDA